MSTQPAERPEGAGTPSRRDRRRRPLAGARLLRARLLALALLAVGYGADQLTKWWVETGMREGQSITVIDGLLWWRFIRNPGAAFSMGESHTWIFTIVMAVVAVVVVAVLPRARNLWWLLALGGLLAGVLGNLTDRLFRLPGFGVGHVVDFISVPRFAIFNIADSFICVCIAGIALLTLRDVPLGEPRRGAEEARETSGSGTADGRNTSGSGTEGARDAGARHAETARDIEEEGDRA